VRSYLRARVVAAIALFSLWLAALFAGAPGGWAAHLLLAFAVALFPWRAARLL